MQSLSKKTTPSPTKTPHTLLVFLLFASLLLVCYANSFRAEWHFDDIANIVLNSPLHLNDLSLQSLSQTFFAYPDSPGKFTRPVSNLSVALNWYFGQDDVFGYHIVNFLIHLFTTFLLYKTCLLLLETPKTKERFKDGKFFIAVLAATLWAINPIQTQAITYIVQRMASLAALFYITGIWFFLKARYSQMRKKSIFFYCGVLLSFLLAMGSKENAILFPLSIMLIEWIFFQPSIRFTKKNIITLILTLTAIFLLSTLFVGPGFLFNLFNSYESRNFTLYQRVLTEARIVVSYLSLLFYPAPFRLSITHDITLSTSLFTPLTTLPAILFLSLLTISSFLYHRRFPLLSFAILFFLLNHIIESTIIPLELFFEHRNYLPSLFLFLPVAAGIWFILDRYKIKSRLIYTATIVALTCIIILLALGTISRNRVWKTERSLWTDSLAKAPNTTRSYINLAHGYLFQDKNYKKAFELNYLSLDKYSPTPWKDRLRANNNMAFIMTSVGNYKEALNFYDKALEFAKQSSSNSMKHEIIYNKTKTLWLMGKPKEALENITPLILAKPNNGKFLQRYGELLIATGEPEKGIVSLQKALKELSPQSFEYKMTLLNFSLFYSHQNSMTKAVLYDRLAQRLNAPPIPTLLCIIETSLYLNNTNRADTALKILLSQLTWPELMGILQNTSPNRPTLPLDTGKLFTYVNTWLTAQEN